MCAKSTAEKVSEEVSEGSLWPGDGSGRSGDRTNWVRQKFGLFNDVLADGAWGGLDDWCDWPVDDTLAFNPGEVVVEGKGTDPLGERDAWRRYWARRWGDGWDAALLRLTESRRLTRGIDDRLPGLLDEAMAALRGETERLSRGPLMGAGAYTTAADGFDVPRLVPEREMQAKFTRVCVYPAPSGRIEKTQVCRIAGVVA